MVHLHLRLVILAGIDIGSNAARLLISKITTYKKGQIDFNKLNLIRIPLQLGIDVFQNGEIGEKKAENFIKTMESFKTLMEIYEVEQYRAVATSAMRDAKNGELLAKKIKKKTGINIEIITGQEEASILYENHLSHYLVSGDRQLFIDVGGGSTEITLYVDNTVVQKQSFNIGTIRILNKQVNAEQWQEMKSFIKQNIKGIQGLQVIGSGGNINKLFSMSKTKEGSPLSYRFLQQQLKKMEPLSVEERIHEFNLRMDRASVIVPAMNIYLSIMKWGDIKQIYVPKIGLADAIVKHLYYSIK